MRASTDGSATTPHGTYQGCNSAPSFQLARCGWPHAAALRSCLCCTRRRSSSCSFLLPLPLPLLLPLPLQAARPCSSYVAPLCSPPTTIPLLSAPPPTRIESNGPLGTTRRAKKTLPVPGTGVGGSCHHQTVKNSGKSSGRSRKVSEQAVEGQGKAVKRQWKVLDLHGAALLSQRQSADPGRKPPVRCSRRPALAGENPRG